jgi:hypothetical protein
MTGSACSLYLVNCWCYLQIDINFIQVDPDDVIQPAVEQMRHGTVLYNLHCGVALVEQTDDESNGIAVPVTATGGDEMTAVQKREHDEWLRSKASKLVLRPSLFIV